MSVIRSSGGHEAGRMFRHVGVWRDSLVLDRATVIEHDHDKGAAKETGMFMEIL